MLEIFHALKQKRQNAVLLLVGNGELKQNIENKAKVLGISDSIIFAGIRSDVPDLLSAMDVFVFPSFYEGMPNTVIEAQATGLLCVIADTITKEAGVTDCIHFKPLTESAEAWAELAVSLFDNRKEERSCYNDKMKNAGYDIDDCVERFVDLVFESGVINDANQGK